MCTDHSSGLAEFEQKEKFKTKYMFKTFGCVYIS